MKRKPETMSEEKDYEFGPNPERYADLSKPVDSDVALASMKAFFSDVARLREKHRIAEVITVCGVHCHGEKEGSKYIATMTLAMGDSTVAAELGAVAYSMYTAPLVESAMNLVDLAGMAKPKLLTRRSSFHPRLVTSFFSYCIDFLKRY